MIRTCCEWFDELQETVEVTLRDAGCLDENGFETRRWFSCTDDEQVSNLLALHNQVKACWRDLREHDRNQERLCMEAEGDFSDSWKTLWEDNWTTLTGVAWWGLEGRLHRAIKASHSSIEV